MAVTRTFRISGLVSLVALLLIILGANGVLHNLFMPLGILGACFAWPCFFFSGVRHLLRGMLWRVGSRLLVSYLLIGVVPLPFLLGLAYLATIMLSGQLAARRVDAALSARLSTLETAARKLVQEPLQKPEARENLEETARELGASWAIAPGSGKPEGSGPPAVAELLPARDVNGSILARVGKEELIGAGATGPAGKILLYDPAGGALERRLENATNVVVHFTGASVRKKGKDGAARSGITIDRDDDESESNVDVNLEAEMEKKGVPKDGLSGPIRGRWVTWMLILNRPVVEWESGRPADGQRLVAVVRSSIAREMKELFAGSRVGGKKGEQLETGVLVLKIMQGLAIFTAGVYLIAALLAALLVVRIARATGRLSTAFGELGAGRFGVRAELKGHDQLAELVRGFNAMSEHLASAMSARAQQESTQHELQLARDLQRRLLPPHDFTFPGVEIAADFQPAAEIGGDFYHFAQEPPDRLVIAIADVSGHGLPTGIVMASAKASLSALAAAGMPTPELFEALDRELRATTDARTFVTLTHARFRLREGAVDVTNAGHVYPYRVTPAGEVSAVEIPSRPLGLALPRPGGARTVTVPTGTGDLWIFLSDGIVEALSPAGEVFGFERLEAILATGGGLPAQEMIAKILQAWRAHTGGDEPEDDRTLLVLRVS